jgi:predicted secreted protein
MSNGYLAFGTTLSWNSQALAEVVNLTGPSMKADAKEMTSHDSTGGFREYLSGLKDGGEITLDLNFVPGDTNGIIALVADYKAGTARTAVITGPTAAAFTWTATAIVTSVEPSFPFDDKLGISVTLKLTGVPVMAVTASTGMASLTGIEENTGAALTFNPTFAIGTLSYVVAVNTASTYIKLTPTAGSHTITISNGTSEQTVTSGAQSGEIDLGSAGTITTVTVKVKETGKMAKTYTIYVSRP